MDEEPPLLILDRDDGRRSDVREGDDHGVRISAPERKHCLPSRCHVYFHHTHSSVEIARTVSRYTLVVEVWRRAKGCLDHLNAVGERWTKSSLRQALEEGRTEVVPSREIVISYENVHAWTDRNSRSSRTWRAFVCRLQQYCSR